jgi:hypothetical protein
MKKTLLTSIFSALIVLSTSAYAQEQPPPKKQPPPSQQKEGGGDPVTVTGCLKKGSSQGDYVIDDKKSGDKIKFTASSKLDAYVNQTVELTGTMSSQGGEKMFQPETVKSVAASCSAE